jgi:hypothetical protein
MRTTPGEMKFFGDQSKALWELYPGETVETKVAL